MAYTDMQVMITLATAAYLDMDPAIAPPPLGEPEGPTVQGQQAKLFGYLNGVLGQTGLATDVSNSARGQEPNWTVPWVGLSNDQANFAYIAKNKTTGDLAVALRGSVFHSNPLTAGPIDEDEDMDVGTPATVTFCGEDVEISAGANEALTEITQKTTCQVGDLAPQGMNDTNLVEALTALGAGAADGPVVYVTGHSLGGCMTTTVALYLLSDSALESCIFQVYNFAGPTAGTADFAQLFNDKFGGQSLTENSSWRVVNVWDAVPNAWQTLDNLDGFYPWPGPYQDAEVKAMVAAAKRRPGQIEYVQPANEVLINDPDWTSATRDTNITGTPSKALFMDQVAFQHFPNFTYMPLLGVPELGAAMAACNVGPAGLGSASPPKTWSNAPAAGSWAG